MPQSCAGGECHYGYDFNPKYNDYINKAANYFAGFSNNANIVQTSSEDCEQRNDYKPYQVIPYKAADLFNEGMCLYNEQNDILSPIYDPQPDDKGEHRRYFRTEFIDRRFDYDAFFITGHRGIHCDINAKEEDIIKTASANGCNPLSQEDACTIWDKGRISALTYNGIDMLYNDDNGRKNIISDTSGTEYKYNLSNATIELNMDSAKRFYDSKLYYGNGKYIDLSQAFYYANNSCPRAFYYDSIGQEIDCVFNRDPLSPENHFKNFGLVGGTVQGYPSKRWVDYYCIPYGDNYTFYNVSCGYENLRIEETSQQIRAAAVPSETVTFDIEACELITFLCNDFESDCKANHYNIMYSGATEGNCWPEKIVDLPFKIDTTGSAGFRTKIENLGIRICWDDENHSNLNKIKSATTFETCTGTVNNTTVKTIATPDVFDTSETFKNKTFNGETAWNKNYKFINVIFDRMYYSQAADSLMKRIRVLNTSTIYNVSNFGFHYTDHKIVSDTFVIKAGDISISADTENTPSNPGGESGGNTNDGGSVNSTETGSNTNDVESKRKHDYTEFTFNSFFIANCMGRFCAKITLGGVTALYTLYENSVGIIQRDRDEGIVKIGIIWSQHKNLLREVNEAAKVTIYMNIENEIKGKEDKAHMEFALAFKMTENGITEDLEPQSDGMSVIDDDDQQEPNYQT